MKTYTPEIIFGTFQELSRIAANIVITQHRNVTESGQTFHLGTATGSSHEGTYQELKSSFDRGDFRPSDKNILLTQLDNYMLSPWHKQGYDTEIYTNVCSPLGLSREVLQVPPAHGENLEERILEFDNGLSENPIHVQLLGLGEDAHIAFVKPRSLSKGEITIDAFLHEGTKKVDLPQGTRTANSRFFDGKLELVPTHAVTRGAASILASKINVILVNKFTKLPATLASLLGPVCPEIPASMLQLHNRTLWLIADELEAVVRAAYRHVNEDHLGFKDSTPPKYLDE